MRTLTIDVGGTGIKLLPIDDEGGALATRHRELTPRPSTPEVIMAVIHEMVAPERRVLPPPGTVSSYMAGSAPIG